MQQLICPIAKGALLYPNHLAIETDEESLSYQDLENKVQCFQSYIKTLSLPSSNIGIIATVCVATICMYFAALREQLSVCMLNPKDPPSLLEEKIQELDLTLIQTPKFLNLVSKSNTSIPMQHLSTYLYTSGSSSKPKIACLSFQNHYYSALGTLKLLQITYSSRLLLSLPLHHVSGLSILFRSFFSLATLVITSNTNINSSLLEKKNISHISLVSTQYIRLLTTCAPLPPPSLKAILLGGSFFSTYHLEEGILKKLPIYLSYGLTEMSSIVCCNPLLATKNTKSSGNLLPYRKLKIDNHSEILVSGKTLFMGYYCIEKKHLVPNKGWFKTKDLGSFSLEKGLLLQGRKDRLIISGGENIQPEEIEEILLSIQGISKALIISIPDKEFGQKMIALISHHSLLNLETLYEILSKRLPKYKLPKTFLSWPKELEASSLKVSACLKETLVKYALSHLSLQ